MEQLTEENIKVSALKFIKAYYKFRDRAGETTSSYDMKTESGIVADGYLQYTTTEGKRFLATFEASSLDKIDEVQFKILHRVLFWDSLAVGTLMASLAFSVGHVLGNFTIIQLGISGMVFSLLVITAIFSMLYFIFFRGLQRYRYIYAIEQFKKYNADDQWVAMGENVFPFSDDPYFQELKKQCIFYGFGLIIVDKQLDPLLLVSPSRNNMFANQRADAGFSVAEGAVLERPKKTWRSYVPKVPKFRTTRTDTNRYQRSSGFQMMLFGISMALIGGIFYKEINNKEFAYVNELRHEQLMAEKAAKAAKEPMYIDKDADERAIAFHKVPDSYLDQEFKHRKEDIKAFAEEIPLNETVPDAYEESTARLTSKGEQIPVFISSENEEVTFYDCERIYNFKGQKYVVQDGMFADLKDAQLRMQFLKAKGLMSHCLWLGCFSGKYKDYIVYIDLIQNTKTEARQLKSKLVKDMKAKQLVADNLKVRILSR